MWFHVLSDLHLEFAPFILEKPIDADALILAGDIGDPASTQYEELIVKAAAMYKQVFVVKGNHESYGYTVEKPSETIARLCSDFPNVTYLDKNSMDLNDELRIIGTTLWSDIQDYQRYDIGESISDFRCIKEWSIEMNNHEHFKDVKYIKDEIIKAAAEGKRLIIVTHHAPYTRNTSRREHLGSGLSSAFATDLSSLLHQPIVAWVYGHTHHSNTQNVNGVMLISNQRGYSDETTSFDPLFTFEI